MNVEKFRQGKFWAISVPQSEVYRALALLESERFLKRPSGSLSDSGAVLLQGSEERFEQRVREVCLKTEQSLEQIPGVLEARVHLSRESRLPAALGESIVSRTASVLLVHREGITLDPIPLKNFVSSAVGVAPERLSLLFQETKAPVLRSMEKSSDHFGSRLGTQEILGPLAAAAGLALLFLLRRIRTTRNEHEDSLLNALRVHPPSESLDPFPLEAGDESNRRES